MNKRIDFLQIGFQKCGTMFLEKNVYALHPDITCIQGQRNAALEHALLHDFILPDSFEYDQTRFERNFEQCIASLVSEKPRAVNGIMFEAFTFMYEKHFDRKVIVDRIHESFPDTKIIMLIRNQETWFVSIYSQYVRSGGVLNFHDFLELALHNPLLIGHYVDWYPFVSYLFNVFGKERVLVCLFEELGRSPQNLADKIFSFLQVLPPGEIDQSIRNESLSTHMLWVRRMCNRIIPFDYGRSSYSFFRNLWGAQPTGGARLWHSFIYKYYKVNTDRMLRSCDRFFNNKRRVSLSSLHKEKIHKRYADNNKKLSHLLDIDVSQLGYPT